MTYDILTIPCLSDNYAYILRDFDTGKTALIDVPDHAPVIAALNKRGWGLDEIWLTHHHHDHIQGVGPLQAATGAIVKGARDDAHRLPRLHQGVVTGDILTLGGLQAHVMDVPGHTIGHIAFYVPKARAVFSGDSLMALGCGRLFEGDGPMMWRSLQKLRDLPGDIWVYSGHEYTQSNARFALWVDPDNAALHKRAAQIDAARAQSRPTIPSRLSDEIATNPFLRADSPEFAHLGDDPDHIFTHLRKMKDQF
jgi:hydroxyacylglutathione hydrolase